MSLSRGLYSELEPRSSILDGRTRLQILHFPASDLDWPQYKIFLSPKRTKNLRRTKNAAWKYVKQVVDSIWQLTYDITEWKPSVCVKILQNSCCVWSVFVTLVLILESVHPQWSRAFNSISRSSFSEWSWLRSRLMNKRWSKYGLNMRGCDQNSKCRSRDGTKDPNNTSLCRCESCRNTLSQYEPLCRSDVCVCVSVTLQPCHRTRKWKMLRSDQCCSHLWFSAHRATAPVR